MSHPTWVRGLKLNIFRIIEIAITVAPYVGAWIETRLEADSMIPPIGRTLRGCVD